MVIHWNADPTAINLGFLHPRWYGIAWGLAFYLSYVVMRRIFVREQRPLADLDNLSIMIILGTIVGARLGHVIFYDFVNDPSLIISDPLLVFRIWNGGLASHGGALGIMTALVLFYRKHAPRYTMAWLFDRLAIVAALSGGIIRIGNLFNSEIYGHPTSLPWGVVFERTDPTLLPRHPTQVYEAILCFFLLGLTWWMYRRGVATRSPGRLFGVFLVLLFSGRFAIEFIKEIQVDVEASFPLNMGQLLSLPFIALGIWYLVRSRTSATTRSAS